MNDDFYMYWNLLSTHDKDQSSILHDSPLLCFFSNILLQYKKPEVKARLYRLRDNIRTNVQLSYYKSFFIGINIFKLVELSTKTLNSVET